MIAIQNRGQKDIAGIKGMLEFDDMFGSLVKDLNLSMDDPVKAGQIMSTSAYGVSINQFIDSDVKLAQTDLSKLKVVFHPQMIVFADGTNMAAPVDTVTTP